MNTKVKNVQMTNAQHFPRDALFCHIPRKHLVTPPQVPDLGCLATVLIGCCGAEMFFHTVHPDILSVVFTVTKGGAWKTVLQHGEGRPEGPQQRGRGRDGMPLFF